MTVVRINDLIQADLDGPNRPDQKPNCAVWYSLPDFKADYKLLFTGIIFALALLNVSALFIDKQYYCSGERPVTMEIKIDRILNVDGLPCPQPTIITMETLKKMKLGETLEIISNNKQTIEAINNLCRKRNYTLRQTRKKQGRTHFIVQK